MIIVYFLVLNVLTAIFYGNYKDASKQTMSKLIEDQMKQICRAFEILVEGERVGDNQVAPSRSFLRSLDDKIHTYTAKSVTKTLFPVNSSLFPSPFSFSLFKT